MEFGVAPTASVELQEFRGRLFVTGESWGVAVPPGASAGDIGDLLLRGLAGERARQRPLVETLVRMTRRDRAEERGWERFCRREVGVDVAEYEPEKRIEVIDLAEGELRVRSAMQS